MTILSGPGLPETALGVMQRRATIDAGISAGGERHARRFSGGALLNSGARNRPV